MIPLLLVSILHASGLSIHSEREGTLKVWQRSEFSISQIPAVENPFDPDQIAIDALITAPSGAKYRIPAFWMQPYSRALVDGYETITEVGDPGWRLRFTPSEAGTYQLQLLLSQNNEEPQEVRQTTFEVDESSPNSSHGFARLGNDLHSLQTDDGNLLKLIGENVCWSEGRGTYDYDRWLKAMATSGQNFFRIWLSPWHLPLEHKPGTLNHYAQNAAFQLDCIFEKAEELGMYMMISFDHHGMFQLMDPTWGGTNSFWESSNPYSVTNGGPCAKPNDFFTNSGAKHFYQKRLRYLVARYGYSTQLLNWQFFNEIDNAYDRAPLNPYDVSVWHAEMAKWFAANDPYDHLVSTSLTGDSDRQEIWQIPDIDFSVFHSYGDPAPARFNAQLAESYIKTYRKPYMVGEFGTSAFSLNIDEDPHMRGFRQVLWGAVMGGSFGSSMSWWWEDIHRQNLYPIYRTMHDTLTEAGWKEGCWKPIDLLLTSQPNRLGQPLKDQLPFNAILATTSNNRMHLSGKVAIANELSAKRSAEFIQSFLNPVDSAPRHSNQLMQLRGVSNDHVSIEIESCFASNGALLININGIESDTSLELIVDDQVALIEHFKDTDGAKRHSNELNQTFEIPVPEGKHHIRLLNKGAGWIEFNRIQLKRVQPSEFADNWTYEPEVLALGNGEGRAVVYIVSPYIVYPCGAKDYNPTTIREKSITLPDFPDGEYSIQWISPSTGAVIASNMTDNSVNGLCFGIPAFNEDLLAVIKKQ